MEPTRPQGFAQVNGRDAPEDPWELWKSTIEQLWMVENRKLPEIVSLMKDNHGFDAVTNTTSRNGSGRRALRRKQSRLLRPSCKREQRRENHLLLSLSREDRLIERIYDDTSRRLLGRMLS